MVPPWMHRAIALTARAGALFRIHPTCEQCIVGMLQ
jgi:hypothetical protein